MIEILVIEEINCDGILCGQCEHRIDWLCQRFRTKRGKKGVMRTLRGRRQGRPERDMKCICAEMIASAYGRRNSLMKNTKKINEIDYLESPDAPVVKDCAHHDDTCFRCLMAYSCEAPTKNRELGDMFKALAGKKIIKNKSKKAVRQ